MKHTHAYWAKDDADHIGGTDAIDYAKLWDLPIEFQDRYEVRPDGQGGYSVVKVAIENKHDLAFHLAVMHTLQEINKLWMKVEQEDARLSSGIKLTEVFGFGATDLKDKGIQYQVFFSKSSPPAAPENIP